MGITALALFIISFPLLTVLGTFQMNSYKDHVAMLRESMQLEKQKRQDGDSKNEALKRQLQEVMATVKQLQGNNESLETKLTTAHLKLREAEKNTTRASLGVS